MSYHEKQMEQEARNVLNHLREILRVPEGANIVEHCQKLMGTQPEKAA